MKKCIKISIILVLIIMCVSCKKSEIQNLDTINNNIQKEEKSENEALPTDEITKEEGKKTNGKVLEESPFYFKFLYGEEYWDQYDLTNAAFQTKEEYEAAVRKYMDEIATLLHREDWYKNYSDNNKDTMYIKLDVGDNKYAGETRLPTDYTMNSSIVTFLFKKSFFTRKYIPIVHELTHLITYDKTINRGSFSQSIEEGICEYTSRCFASELSSMSHGVDIHTMVLYVTNQFLNKGLLTENEISEIKDIVGSEGSYPYVLLTSKSIYWQYCSASFTDYLIQTYGLDSVMNIFYGKDESIYLCYHEDGLKGLRRDWLEFLNSYENQMTEEEITKYMSDYNKGLEN